MGVGKSTVANHLLEGEAEFKTGKDPCGVTQETQIETSTKHQLTVWDLPGFGDPSQTTQEFMTRNFDKLRDGI